MNQKLQIIIIISLLAGILASFPLWMNDRSFPILPIFDFFVTGGLFHFSLLSLFFVTGLLSVFDFKFSTHSLFLFLFLILVLCLQDQNRWQPWVYIFSVLLAFVFSYRCKMITEKTLFTLFRIAFIGIYFWSGIHKVNAGFITNTLPELVVPDLGALSYSIPLAEAFLGVGLIFISTRKISVLLLLGMHSLILYEVLFGFFTFNTVIIPWNLAMMFLLVFLFWNKDPIQLFSNPSVSKGFAIFIFLILPATNFFNLWPGYPSFNLFSGKTAKAYLYVDEDFKTNFSSNTLSKFDDENRITVHSYSYSELNVPFYSEKEVYLQLFNKLCERSSHEFSVVMEIKTLQHLFKNEWSSESYFCDQLENDSPAALPSN
ncbi:MAG: hypothetical protein RIE52_00100 [Balneola sp.]